MGRPYRDRISDVATFLNCSPFGLLAPNAMALSIPSDIIYLHPKVREFSELHEQYIFRIEILHTMFAHITNFHEFYLNYWTKIIWHIMESLIQQQNDPDLSADQFAIALDLLRKLKLLAMTRRVASETFVMVWAIYDWQTLAQALEANCQNRTDVNGSVCFNFVRDMSNAIQQSSLVGELKKARDIAQSLHEYANGNTDLVLAMILEAGSIQWDELDLYGIKLSELEQWLSVKKMKNHTDYRLRQMAARRYKFPASIPSPYKRDDSHLGNVLHQRRTAYGDIMFLIPAFVKPENSVRWANGKILMRYAVERYLDLWHVSTLPVIVERAFTACVNELISDPNYYESEKPGELLMRYFLTAVITWDSYIELKNDLNKVEVKQKMLWTPFREEEERKCKKEMEIQSLLFHKAISLMQTMISEKLDCDPSRMFI